MASSSSIALNRFNSDDVAAADALLRQAESQFSVVPRSDTPAAPKPESTERQAAPETKTEPTAPNSLPSGTPADAAAPAQPSAPKQSTETQGDTGKGSAFAKNQARLQGTWQQVNEEKAKIAAEKQAIQAERVRFQEEQQRFQQQQQATSRNKLTPELYEQTAAQNDAKFEDCKLKLEGLKALKGRYEAAGQYTEAARLDTQIEQMEEEKHAAKIDAKRCRDAAVELRKNPDLSGKALADRNAQHLQHYTVEACKKWPELGQANSEFQKATAKAISTLRQSGLDENNFPVLRYFAAEHVAAQSAAARVPVMEKELVQLRARVKELETNSTPGGGTSAAPNLRPSAKPMSLEAEGEALRQMAIDKGAKG